MFGRKRDEVSGGWRKLHNKEFHNLYSSPNIINMIKSEEEDMNRTYSAHGGDNKCIQTFVILGNLKLYITVTSGDEKCR
jgi:hypothetical protein